MSPAPTVLERPVHDVGRPPPPGSGNGDGRGPERSGPSDGASVAVLGVWVALAPILMLFLAFVSAYVVRQGLGTDWSSNPLPQLLWINTGILLGSSAILERGRAVLRTAGSAQGWLLATLACGILFVVGQLLAWRQWSGQGIGISSTPHSAFFYLLTGTHAVHVAGGLLALAAAAFWPARRVGGMTRPLVARLAATYWHFMGILWVGIFLVLSLWR